MRTCPSCGAEDVSVITNLATGERFCPRCATSEEVESPVVKVARKIAEHEKAGTLDQYPLEERLADLRGEKYVKPN